MRNNKVEQTHQEVKAYVGHNSIIFQTWRIDFKMWSTLEFYKNRTFMIYKKKSGTDIFILLENLSHFTLYQIVTSANPRATLNFSIWLILVKDVRPSDKFDNPYLIIPWVTNDNSKDWCEPV